MQDDRGQFVGVRWSTMENPLSSCREWQLDRWHSLECSQPMVGKRLEDALVMGDNSVTG